MDPCGEGSRSENGTPVGLPLPSHLAAETSERTAKYDAESMKGVTFFAVLGTVLAVQAQEDDLGLPQVQVPPPEQPAAAGYFLHDGVVYALIGDQALPVDKELTLRITPSGVIGFDGQQIPLPAGQLLLAEGGYAPVPSAAPAPIVLSTTAPVPPSAASTSATAPASTTVISTTVFPATAPAPARAITIEPPTPDAVTAESPISPSTVPPPQPPFASISRPDRTGPRTDYERPVDRTRPESVPFRKDDPTKLRDEQRPPDATRQGTDRVKYRDRTNQGVDDYKRRDRTNQGPDDERPPDPTRRPAR